MACSSAIFACLLLASLAPGAVSSAVTPVQQVLNMMEEMKTKGEKSMEEEQKIYATYSEWVSDRTRELAFEIKTGETTIEELLAYITKADSDVDNLGEAIKALESEVAALQKEKADATSVRTEEHTEYLKVSADYGESVDALERAVQVIAAKQGTTAQAMMFLQEQAAKVNGMRRVLAAFLEMQDSTRQPGAPAVGAYESQSGGILEMLETLLKKFKKELADVEEAESNQAHYYDLEMIHLTDSINQANSDRDEKASMKAQRASESGDAKGKLAQTKTDLAEDQALTAEISSTFQTKTGVYNENQKVRAAELEAISKAIEIIADPSVAGSYGEHVNLVQKPSLLQVSSMSKRSVLKTRAATYLQQQAKALESKTLANVVLSIKANPFAKVIDMIKDMIAKLKEEAAAEAAHNAWCAEQLKDNKIKRDKKTAKVNLLTATIEDQTSQIATMAKQIATLTADQASLSSAMKEATEQREAEHAKNTDTIADAKAGAAAVKQALEVLKEFYASQSFLQVKKQAPEMAAYKGMSNAKGGVVGMLEVIESDFLRLETDTTSAEEAASSEYATFMEDAKADKDAKHEAEVQLKLDKDQLEFEKSQTNKDLDEVSAELDKANAYYDQLKPQCLEVKVSYEERVAKRKQEIESLKEAYKILDEQ